MGRIIKTALGFGLSLAATALTLAAEQPRRVPLSFEAALNEPHLADLPLDLSPDGQWVAYTVRRSVRDTPDSTGPSWYTDTGVPRIAGYGGDVWVADIATHAATNVTGGQGSSWNPVWSPDSRVLAFYSDRDGAARLWIWDRQTNRLRRVSEAIVRPTFDRETVRWAPDGRMILVRLLPADLSLASAHALMNPTAPPDQPSSTIPGATVRLLRNRAGDVDDTTQRTGADASQAVGLAHRELADLSLIDVSSGRVMRLAVRVHPRWYAFSPDGAAIAYMNASQIALSPAQTVHDLQLVSAAGGSPRTLAAGIRDLFWGTAVRWSSDSAHLAYVTSPPSSATQPASASLVVVRVATSARTTIDRLPPTDDVMRAPQWDAAGRRVYAVLGNAIWTVGVGEAEARELARIDGRSICEIVAANDGGPHWAPDRASLVVLTRDRETHRAGVWTIDTGTGRATKRRESDVHVRGGDQVDIAGDGRRVVFVQEAVDARPAIWTDDATLAAPALAASVVSRSAQVEMGTSRVIEYRSLDGERVRAAVLLPAGYREGQRYPLIARVYSGIRMSNRVHQYGIEGEGVFDLQLFATRGYAVLVPDMPSRGRQAMRDTINYVLPGVDKLIELGIADPDRLGVSGHSYGGYTVLSLIAQTTRFKAAFESAGFGNWLSAYGEMREDGSAFNTFWLERGPHGVGATPWEALHRYLDNSPYASLDRVTTPLLIVHGDRDASVPIHQADQIFVGLRRLGREVEYARYAGEGHVPGRWSHANQLDYLTRMMAWFDRYLPPASNASR